MVACEDEGVEVWSAVGFEEGKEGGGEGGGVELWEAVAAGDGMEGEIGYGRAGCKEREEERGGEGISRDFERGEGWWDWCVCEGSENLAGWACGDMSKCWRL